MSGEIFGRGAGKDLAEEMDLPFLGTLELRADYRDDKKPAVLMSDAIADEYHEIAENLRAEIASRAE